MVKPLIPVINGYAKAGEEIRVITVTPDTESAWFHVRQLVEELSALQERRGFVCAGIEAVPGFTRAVLHYAGEGL